MTNKKYNKFYYAYEAKNERGDYSLVKTQEEKIVTFRDKEQLREFIQKRNTGLVRILDITSEINEGNIPIDRLEILD